MMEIDITLDQLPEHILIDIFEFVPKKLDLRLVCKTFKNVIDFSTKLLKNIWLMVNRAACDYSNTINYHFQNFILFYLNYDIYCWMSQYNQKDLVKSMKITCTELEIEESATDMQFILLNYNSLETIRFEPHEIDFGTVSDYHVRFMPNQFSKLKTLDVDDFSDRDNNNLEMFADIPSVKNLIINMYSVLKFPSMVKWQLEQLILHFRENEIDDNSFKQFLQSQHSTLKKLILDEFDGYAYFVMRNLPNLEHLKLYLPSEEEIDDSLLLKNGNLRYLDIDYDSDTDSNVIKAVLNQYDRIEYLSIVLSNLREATNSLSFGINFKNLTHLALNGLQSFSILNINSFNIKTLIMSYHKAQNYDFSQLSNENLKNVEKLCLNFRKVEDVIAVVQKCPKLTELNLETDEWLINQKKTIINSINQILEVAVNLKLLGITEYSLRKQQLTREEVLIQISTKGISLKFYKDFKSMFADCWGQDNASHIKIW